MKINCYSRPNEPAVIPTLTKKPNSNKSFAPVGIEINANHLKSVTEGWVFGKSIPIKVGRKIQVWETKITNENNDLICISRLTLAVLKK